MSAATTSRRREVLPSAARAAEFYDRALGFALVEIPPGGKKPTRPGWQHNPMRDLDHWLRHPDHGMGLLHAESRTCTLDADGTLEHVALALEAVGVDYRKMLDSPGPKMVGNAEKPPKLLFRLPDAESADSGKGLGRARLSSAVRSDPGASLFADPSRKVLCWPDRADSVVQRVVFELRAGRVQDVLPPSTHPGTGRPYQWIGCPRTRDQIPVLPAELLRVWQAWRDHLPRLTAACPWAPVPVPVSPPSGRSTFRPRELSEPSIIDDFNRMIDVNAILARHGYKPVGRGRWLAPGSSTGDPGVVLLDDGRVYSHHGSDVLADGHAHDAFDLIRLLEHGGDVQAAIQAARFELGLIRVRSLT